MKEENINEINKILDNISEGFPLLDISRDKNEKEEIIILIGEIKDFDFFVEELNEVLPKNIKFKTKLFLENKEYNYNEMDIYLFEK